MKLFEELPIEINEKIIFYLSYNEMCQHRVVSKHFNCVFEKCLNRGWLEARTLLEKTRARLDEHLPKRKSLKMKHQLYCLSVYMGVIDCEVDELHSEMESDIKSEHACFFAGLLLDELFKELSMIKKCLDTNNPADVPTNILPLSTYGPMVRIRDYAHMALDNFNGYLHKRKNILHSDHFGNSSSDSKQDENHSSKSVLSQAMATISQILKVDTCEKSTQTTGDYGSMGLPNTTIYSCQQSMAQNPRVAWQIGIVACTHVSLNIVGIVFVDNQQPLYILPAHLFRLSEEEKRGLSKSQILRLTSTPITGDNIEFEANENRVITSWAKSKDFYESTFSNDGYMQILTNCVISPEPIRRCWSRLFGVLPIQNQIKMRDYLPNIMYKCGINLWFDLKECQEKEDGWVDLDTYRPTFTCQFADVKEVYIDVGLETVIHSAPWNRHMPLIIYAADPNDDDPNVGELPQLDIYHEHKYGISLVIDPRKNQVFCLSYPSEDCKLANYPSRRGMYKPGLLISVHMFFCKYNKCNVIYKFSRLEQQDPFPHDFDESGEIILLVPVVELGRHAECYNNQSIDKRKRYFYSYYTTLIDDPHNLMPNFFLYDNEEVWLKFKGVENRILEYSNALKQKYWWMIV
ncbi:F-box only protein 28 [Ditylenchus destructor]|uniref:F-box only protein 28 n=1 Tax=Ditylenchus destructor TaxID=166010 RepID=A0AAD4N5Q7_9BILA|nr:F-box only protein 28 [Ditylenchus destructor]